MHTAVFDLDGTLAETAPDLIGAANDLLAARNLAQMDPSIARTTAGRGGKALIDRGFKEAGRPLSSSEVDALFPAYLEAYAARIDQETSLYPGVLEALDRLSGAGWRLTICTNKPQGLAETLLGRLGVRDRFRGLVGADTLPVRKPDPRPVWEAIARAGGAADGAVMIGDSKTDRDAGRNAEIPVVLVSFGYAAEPIAALKPDAVIDHFDELGAALEAALGR